MDDEENDWLQDYIGCEVASVRSLRELKVQEDNLNMVTIDMIVLTPNEM